MKKLIATLALCSLPLISVAYDDCPGKEKMYDSAVSQLQLTDDQKAKMKALHDKHKAEMDKEHDTIKAMRDKQREEVKAVLGEEKYKKFEELMDHPHGKHGGMGMGDGKGMHDNMHDKMKDHMQDHMQ
ncbi:MAG TPA: hypothetical protein VFM46_03290 [Pseudomonadales bacterium]|nr:hypothetical protein [Pseudomonadales bacterium]